MDKNYEAIILVQNTFILRMLRVTNFVDIIKIATMSKL